MTFYDQLYCSQFANLLNTNFIE